MAKTAVSYMVIDLQDKTISLKSRGMVLKRWDILKWKYWGWPIPNGTYKLVSKTALARQTARPNITPGKEEKKPEQGKKGAVDLGILELKDMPVRYDLSFGKGIHILVRPAARKFWPSFLSFAKSVSRAVSLPIKTLWASVGKKPFTRIDVIMPADKDAQGVYWSFLDGQSTIIYRPSNK